MEQIRRDLDEDAQDTVEGMRELGDWRSYVKAYPCFFLGAAFAAGYLIIRQPRFQSTANVEQIAEQVSQSRPLDESTLPQKSRTRELAMTFVGNLLMRGVSSYVGDVAGRLIAKHTRINKDDQLHS